MDKNLAALLLRGCREMQPASRFSAEREKEGGKDLVSGGNGPSQTVSPRQQPELKYIIHNKMIFNMICRDVGWHAEETERHPKHSMYKSLSSTERFVDVTLQRCFSPPFGTSVSPRQQVIVQRKAQEEKTCTHNGLLTRLHKSYVDILRQCGYPRYLSALSSHIKPDVAFVFLTTYSIVK